MSVFGSGKSVSFGGPVRGRLTATEINDFTPDPRSLQLNTTASNALIPITFGTDTVPGIISAYGVDGSSRLIVRVVWGMGGKAGIRAIKKVFINDAEPGSTVDVRHYRGGTFQAEDSWLDGVITLYQDDMVLRKPMGGDAGIVYSVFRIPAAALSSAPKFQAIIDGQLSLVPASSSTGDPFYLNVGASIQFTAATDTSTNAHVVTLVNGAAIGSGQLQLDGVNDYASLPDHASLEFGTTPWTIELRCTTTTIAAGTDYLLAKGSGSGTTYCFALYRSGANLLMSLAGANNSYSIISGVTVATSCFVATTEIVIVVEFTGAEYVVWVNGAETYRLHSTTTVVNIASGWQIGALNATNTWTGSVRAFRLTTGYLRYGGCHSVTATPYPDTGTYTAREEFTENSALCFAELARNVTYGLGAVVSGDVFAWEWNNSLLGGATPRSRLSLTIYDARKTEDYLDLLATYSDCLWYYNETGGVTILPDRAVGATTASGQEVVTNAEFTTDLSGWTGGAGWAWNAAIGGIAVKTAGSTTSLYQTVETEIGTKYAITVYLFVFAGSYSVIYDGVTVISGATGNASIVVIPTDTSAVLEIVPSSTASLWVASANMRRLYWLENSCVRDSLQLDGISNADTPTRVTCSYKTPSTTSPNWEQSSEVYEIAGVATGDVPLVETSISMPGIYRAEEAYNKAASRALRMQNRVRASWVTTDVGLIYHKGAVIQLVVPTRNVDMLVIVESVTLQDYGRYAVSGLRYDDNHYPSELPEGTGSVPVGAITLLSNTTIPSGWTQYTAANGKYIVGAGSTYAVNATGGVSSYAGFSGNVTSDGGHAPSDFFNTIEVFSGGGGNLTRFTADASTLGAHVHTYATGTITPSIYRRENILIKKTGTASLTIPAAAMTFGLSGINIPNLVRTVAYQNRLLMAAADNLSAGLSSEFKSLTTGSTDDGHDHWSLSTYSPQQYLSSTVDEWWDRDAGGGSHTHSFNLAVSRNIKRYRLALYAGTGDFTVSPGAIMMWDAAPAGLPAEWIVCDGTGGSPDLRDYFVEVSATGQEGTSTGDNSLAISGNGSAVGHEHKGARYVTGDDRENNFGHGSTVTHTHSISASAAYVPTYWALYFIMFTG